MKSPGKNGLLFKFMRWNWKYALIAFSLLCIEVLIALFVHDQIIRPFVGDLLVVVLLYFGFRAIVKTKASKIAWRVLAFAFFIEILQLFKLLEFFGWEENTFARIVLGSTFAWWDLLAYTIGVLVAYGLDHD